MEKETGLACCICKHSFLEESQGGQGNGSKTCCPHCLHVIHRECLTSWFESEKKTNEEGNDDINNEARDEILGTCPKCKKEILSQDLHSISFETKKKEDTEMAKVRDTFKRWSNATPEERKSLTPLLVKYIQKTSGVEDKIAPQSDESACKKLCPMDTEEDSHLPKPKPSLKDMYLEPGAEIPEELLASIDWDEALQEAGISFDDEEDDSSDDDCVDSDEQDEDVNESGDESTSSKESSESIESSEEDEDL